MTPGPDAGPSRLAALKDSAVRSFTAFRTQIDRTGLFPDLSGEAGTSLRQSVWDEGRITKSYMLMSALSAGIAALGLLQSSTAVVIGAMLISPLMGPIASMGFGFASLDGHQVRDSVRVIAIGAAIGILTGILLTWLSPIRNATPEIIARTEPTLLDLAIAIFSGTAGAYATVQRRGTTAIGVAIATALMPPLATVGYGLGVANMTFALGAFLLFLTNLAAIAFSFALVARFSGAARPLANVEITPRYIVAGVAAFVVLASPLSVTLYRVTKEARAQATVRRLLTQELNLKRANIAQLDVKWPLRGKPSINAVVVAPQYSNDAERRILSKLEAEWGERPDLSLQQVVAADVKAQTAAIVDVAVERSAARMAQDVPPLVAIREAVGLPTQALWVNRAERTVQIVPFAADGWKLGDYRAAEQAAAAAGSGWQVRVIPPVDPHLFVPVRVEEGKLLKSAALEDAFWAIDRWGVQEITVSGVVRGNRSPGERVLGSQMAELAAFDLQKLGIRSRPSDLGSDRLQHLPHTATGVLFVVVGPPRGSRAEEPRR